MVTSKCVSQNKCTCISRKILSCKCRFLGAYGLRWAQLMCVWLICQHFIESALCNTPVIINSKIYVVSIISCHFSCLSHQSSVVRNVQVEILSHELSCQPDLLDGSYGRPSGRPWWWYWARLARLPTTQTKEKHDNGNQEEEFIQVHQCLNVGLRKLWNSYRPYVV